MAKMGYKEGKGLGHQEQGRIGAIEEPTLGPLFSMVWVVLPQWPLRKTQTLSVLVSIR